MLNFIGSNHSRLAVSHQAGVGYTALQWTTVDGSTAYSIFVSVPNSMVVLELMGTSLTATDSFLTVDGARYSSSLPPSWHEDSLVAGRPSMTALKISYASTDVERDSVFYTKTLGATSVLDTTAEVGDQTLSTKAFRFDNDDETNSVEIHFVGSASPAAPSLNPLTVAFYEEVGPCEASYLLTLRVGMYLCI